MMLLSSDPKIQALNVDNMELMADKPDKFWDLAIVDPPYGIDITKQGLGQGGGLYRKPKKYKRGEWDSAVPKKEYFDELKRVSTNQIIWGGNYFNLGPTPCFLFWDKNNGGSDFADGELAWTSFTSPVRKFKFTWSGFIQDDMKNKQQRIHPTEKPVKLYEWLLTKYAKPGFKILDTHGGSMSIAIACYNLGFDLDICEMDADYFKDATDRVKAHIAKPKGLFTYKETMRTEPNKLF